MILLNSTQSLLHKHIKKCLNEVLPRWTSTPIRNKSFESTIQEEKLSANKYILLEDKCGSWAKLDSQIVSHLIQADVQHLHKYKFRGRHCALVQLKEDFDCDVNRFGCDSNSFPMRHRMICINSMPKISPKSTTSKESSESVTQLINTKEEGVFLNANELRRLFKSNEEMLNFLLTDRYLCRLSFMLRFFVIKQLEQLLCVGPFNQFQIMPFGSSLAGFGHSGSDLDLVLVPTSLESNAVNYCSPELMLERSETQRSLEIMADLIHYLIPNFSNVQRILRARIPIIKFQFDLAPIEIDLSIELSKSEAHHGVLMASFLLHCHQAHPCVKDLMIFLRIWAKQHGITKKTPGRWFTNFQLTMLAIYFLQCRNVVPPMSVILNKRPPKVELFKGEVKFLEQLRDFFHFLVNFEFNVRAISVLHARTLSKPDYTPIYIENPIERELNICKNVANSELTKLLNAAKMSLEVMSDNDYSLADVLDPHLGSSKIKSKAMTGFKINQLFQE